MINLFLVATGGAAGAILRFLVTTLLKTYTYNTFYSTLVVNIIGSFLIGYLIYDGIHFYTHHATPKNKVGKYIRKMHLIHHVRDDVMFGPVTSSAAAAKQKAKTSGSTRDASKGYCDLLLICLRGMKSIFDSIFNINKSQVLNFT